MVADVIECRYISTLYYIGHHDFVYDSYDKCELSLKRFEHITKTDDPRHGPN